MGDRIDLHVHSTASDGSFTPTELVRMAKDLGLRAMAISDHDTIGGVAEGLTAGEKIGLEVVPGVELSTDLRGKTVHMLGYFFDPQHKGFHEKLAWAQRQREERNLKMVARFNELGIDMTLAEVEAEAGGDVIGRPHFAQVLIKKGVVKEIQEVFDIYLGRQGKAYIPKFRFTPSESVGIIREAGGLPILAHPGLYDWSPLQIDEAVGDLCDLGLVGLEVMYTDHTPAMVQIFSDIARRRGLAPTGGSDFHGKNVPNVFLGTGKGDLAVPYQWLSDLKQKLVR